MLSSPSSPPGSLHHTKSGPSIPRTCHRRARGRRTPAPGPPTAAAQTPAPKSAASFPGGFRTPGPGARPRLGLPCVASPGPAPSTAEGQTGAAPWRGAAAAGAWRSLSQRRARSAPSTSQTRTRQPGQTTAEPAAGGGVAGASGPTGLRCPRCPLGSSGHHGTLCVQGSRSSAPVRQEPATCPSSPPHPSVWFRPGRRGGGRGADAVNVPPSSREVGRRVPGACS